MLGRTLPAAAQGDTLTPAPDTVRQVDPSRARVVFGATGRTIPQGHGAIVAHYLVLPTATLGVHDRVTLVAGTAVPIVAGQGDLPYWVGGKVGIVQGSGVYVAVGGLYFRIEDNQPSSAVAYAVVTGDLDRLSLTFAGLRGIGGGLRSDLGVMIGASLQLDREWTAIAEGWSMDLWEATPPAVFGLRWSNARAAFTAGFASWRAPYVDFAVQW